MPIRTVYQCDKCGFEMLKPKTESIYDLLKYWTVREDGTVFCPTCKDKNNSETIIIKGGKNAEDKD